MSPRDYSRFGIDIWINRGWDVLVFDFTKHLNKDFWDYTKGDLVSCDFFGLNVIGSSAEGLNKIKGLDGRCIFIDFLGDSLFEQKCRKLAKQKGKTLKVYLGWIPSQQQPFSRRIRRAFLQPKALFEFVVRKVFSTKKTEADYVVVGGAQSEKSVQLMNAEVIRAHNFDYDFVLNDEETPCLKNSHILFLDEDACYHSDFINLGIEPCVTPECYFPTINKGLNLIAKTFGSRVVVALHPRSDPERRPAEFEFPVIKDRTYDLIKDARIIVGHGSTAIQMAVLFRKPILLVTTDELENSFCAGIICGYRSELGKSLINFDHFSDTIDLVAETTVNDLMYDSYIVKYIKQNNTPMKPVWVIVIDKLEADLRIT